MSAHNQLPPEAPPGIDLVVLAKVNALFAQQSTQQCTRLTVKDEDVVSPLVDQVASCLTLTETPNADNSTQGDDNILPEQIKTSQGKDIGLEETQDEDQDEVIWEERGEAENHQPRILARYSYPSESLPAPVKLPPTYAFPSHPPPSPSLTSLIGNVTSYVAGYISSYFTSEPAIIEYSDKEIRKQMKVCVEAQKLKCPDPHSHEKVIRVIALVANRGRKNSEEKARTVEIRAKPKRVREILKSAGGYVAEDVYRQEIRSALKKLGS
jgi:hypothetical protein